jgi:hypothetical protein
MWRREREYFLNKTIYIVGKGPSLDDVNALAFTSDSPIICINDSIAKIESLGLRNRMYMMQQDMSLGHVATQSIILTIEDCRPIYGDQATYFKRDDFNIFVCPTACYAIRMAEYLGASSIVFVAFDACVNQDTRYAQCIGYASDLKRSPNRFLNHRKVIEDVVTLPHVFLNPVGPLR